MFQELLKEWYYTGFFVGTLSFAIFYLVLWSSLIGILQRLGFFRLWYGLEEPMCDLDMDLSLGGYGGDDNMRDRHVHVVEEHDDADNNHLNNSEDNESIEPHFEDWHDFDSPATQDRSIPIPPATDPPPVFHYQRVVSREESDGEWEDIFYPAVDGIGRQ